MLEVDFGIELGMIFSKKTLQAKPEASVPIINVFWYLFIFALQS